MMPAVQIKAAHCIIDFFRAAKNAKENGLDMSSGMYDVLRKFRAYIAKVKRIQKYYRNLLAMRGARYNILKRLVHQRWRYKVNQNRLQSTFLTSPLNSNKRKNRDNSIPYTALAVFVSKDCLIASTDLRLKNPSVNFTEIIKKDGIDVVIEIGKQKWHDGDYDELWFRRKHLLRVCLLPWKKKVDDIKEARRASLLAAQENQERRGTHGNKTLASPEKFTSDERRPSRVPRVLTVPEKFNSDERRSLRGVAATDRFNSDERRSMRASTVADRFGSDERRRTVRSSAIRPS